MRVPFQGGIGVEYFRIWMVFFGFAIGFPISGLAQQNDAVLLCFESSQNPACKRIHPTLTRLVAEGTPVRQVDVLEERFLASRFGVRLTPTFIVLCGGEEVTRLVGVHSTDQLKRALLTTRERSLVPTRSVHETVEPVKIAALYNATRSGDPVFSFGCDRGSQPTRLDTRITGVNKYDQHLGLSNYEIQGAPIDGRSGGGLFDQYGRLVGVCNAADYREDIGIYAGIGAIHWQLERIGLASLIPLQN